MSPRKFQRIRYHTEISAIVDPLSPPSLSPLLHLLGILTPQVSLIQAALVLVSVPACFRLTSIFRRRKAVWTSCCPFRVAGSLECQTAYKFSVKYTRRQGVIACHCSWLRPRNCPFCYDNARHSSNVLMMLLTLHSQLKFLVYKNNIGCCPDSFLLCVWKSGPETTLVLGDKCWWMRPLRLRDTHANLQARVVATAC